MAVKWHCRILAGILMLSAPAAMAVTGMDERKTFVVPRVESPPNIDGKLDDDAWLTAAIIDDFHQTDPGDGVPATEDTIVRVM